jgi:hypothetical protein
VKVLIGEFGFLALCSVVVVSGKFRLDLWAEVFVGTLYFHRDLVLRYVSR